MNNLVENLLESIEITIKEKMPNHHVIKYTDGITMYSQYYSSFPLMFVSLTEIGFSVRISHYNVIIPYEDPKCDIDEFIYKAIQYESLMSTRAIMGVMKEADEEIFKSLTDNLRV
jgi:hypothetical protein